MTGVIEMMRTVEAGGLRDDALKSATLLVDLSDETSAFGKPSTSGSSAATAVVPGIDADDELDGDAAGDSTLGDTDLLESTDAGDDDELDRMLSTTSSLFAQKGPDAAASDFDDLDDLDGTDDLDGADDLDDLDVLDDLDDLGRSTEVPFATASNFSLFSATSFFPFWCKMEKRLTRGELRPVSGRIYHVLFLILFLV